MAHPDLGATWRDLEARSDASFFLGWDWIGCWLKATGLSPLLLIAKDGERVVALALLQPARRGRALVGANALMLHQTGLPDVDEITIEHNDILADRSVADAARRACIAFLVRRAGELAWDELHLAGVARPETYRAPAEASGLTMTYRAVARSWAVDLAEVRRSGGPYLDTLSANTRYQIRRAVRLYEGRGALVATPATSVEQAMTYFTQLKELHQRYWTGRGCRGSFAAPFFEQFHRALITQCLPHGAVELVCVQAGGTAIGYVYNLIHDGWVCAYQTGFVYEADAKLKPGLVSHYLCILQHLRLGARRYDFLAGGDRYKSSLAQPGPDIAHLVLQRPLMKLRLENAARALKRRLLANTPAPGRPGNFGYWAGAGS